MMTQVLEIHFTHEYGLYLHFVKQVNSKESGRKYRKYPCYTLLISRHLPLFLLLTQEEIRNEATKEKGMLHRAEPLPRCEDTTIRINVTRLILSQR